MALRVTLPRMGVRVVWFRRDLRLHDHEPLRAAVAEGDAVVPLFVWDPHAWARDPMTGQGRMGPFRARFWLEAVADLEARLEAVGGRLWTEVGAPREVVPRVARAVGANAVHFHRLPTDEEARTEADVATGLEADGCAARAAEGVTLVHPDDLPFDVSELPNVFSRFRRAVEADLRIRPAREAPERIVVPDVPFSSRAPAWSDLGLEPPADDPRAVATFRGGEGPGLERLEGYVFGSDALRDYKVTRNGLLHRDDSSKLSPWLALGCVSPRRVVAAIERYEVERVKNESTYWLLFELLWRDYFQLLAAREGSRLFRRSGIGGRTQTWRRDRPRFAAWTEGRTGFPFVDAFMRELRSTGFMSNRGRQNVASFLAKGLGIDWRWGAAWFERELVDYDPASNWGNWQYNAGVGTDPRDRTFNVIEQARKYDPDGTFIRKWIPELASVDAATIHDPGPRERGAYPPKLVDLPSVRRRRR